MFSIGLATLALVVASSVSVDGRAGVRVNAPMPVSFSGDVKETRISPDGLRLVYSGSQGELFSRPLDLGTPPVRLGLPAHRVASFLIAPDSARVVYWTEDGRLFSVVSDGSNAPVDLRARISGELGTAISRLDPGIVVTPDAQQVVCLMRMQSGVDELFRVPIAGDANATRLNHALPPGHRVGMLEFHGGTWRLAHSGFQVTDDGSRVLYLAGPVGQQELWCSALADGSAPRKLSPRGTVGPAAPILTRGYRVTPDSRQVVYLAERGEELWSARLDGTRDAVLLERARRIEDDFQISADSRRVLYRPRVLVEGREQVRLHTSLLAGRAPLDVLHGWPATEDVQADFELAQGRVLFQLGREVLLAPLDARTRPVPVVKLPTSSSVHPRFAAGDHIVCHAGELLSVPLRRGAAPIRLAPAAGGVLEYRLTPDRRRLVYRDDSETPDMIELYSVPVDGAQPPVKLNPPLVPGGDVQSVSATDAWPDFEIGPDSATVVYLADQEQPSETLAYRAPIDGRSPALQVSPRFGQPSSAGDVSRTWFGFARDGRVLYLADQEVDELQQLWSVETSRSAPPGPALRLSRPLEHVTDFQLDVSAARAFYRFVLGDPDSWEGRRLATVAVDGSAPAVELNGSFGPHQSVLFFALAPDGSRVVYLADQRADELFDLWSVPSDGSAPPVRLSVPPSGTAGDFVYFGGDFAFTADSTRLIFRASTTRVDGGAELWSVAVDGLSSPCRLDAASADPGTVRAFVLGPDRQRAVFWETTSEGKAARLRSVPVDGGSVETLFEQEIPFGLLPPVVSPDSTRAVLVQLWPNALYRVTLDGSEAPLLLHDAITHGGEVDRTGLTIRADSRQAIYRLTGGSLYAVPLDGSAPPVRLDEPEPGSSVISFLVNPGGREVVYRTATSDGDSELWSARLDRSTRPVRFATRGVRDFRIAGPGERVTWLADEGRLWDARLDGSAQRRLGSPGDVRGTSLAPSTDGSRVLVRADRDLAEVFELYLHWPGPLTVTR